MEKITKREMFEFLAGMADAMMFSEDSKIDAESVRTFCENEIDLLDKKASKAKERAAKKAKEGDALTELVAEVLSDEEFMTIPEVAALVTERDPEATVAKVQYRLGQLVKNDLAEKAEKTIPATETTKTRKVMSYRKFAVPTNDEANV